MNRPRLKAVILVIAAGALAGCKQAPPPPSPPPAVELAPSETPVSLPVEETDSRNPAETQAQ